jgi:hypothetical protein
VPNFYYQLSTCPTQFSTSVASSIDTGICNLWLLVARQHFNTLSSGNKLGNWSAFFYNLEADTSFTVTVTLGARKSNASKHTTFLSLTMSL